MAEGLCDICSASLKDYSIYFSITYCSENYVNLCRKCADRVERERRQNYCTIVQRAEKRADKRMLEIYKKFKQKESDNA